MSWTSGISSRRLHSGDNLVDVAEHGAAFGFLQCSLRLRYRESKSRSRSEGVSRFYLHERARRFSSLSSGSGPRALGGQSWNRSRLPDLSTSPPRSPQTDSRIRRFRVRIPWGHQRGPTSETPSGRTAGRSDPSRFGDQPELGHQLELVVIGVNADDGAALNRCDVDAPHRNRPTGRRQRLTAGHRQRTGVGSSKHPLDDGRIHCIAARNDLHVRVWERR